MVYKARIRVEVSISIYLFSRIVSTTTVSTLRNVFLSLLATASPSLLLFILLSLRRFNFSLLLFYSCLFPPFLPGSSGSLFTSLSLLSSCYPATLQLLPTSPFSLLLLPFPLAAPPPQFFFFSSLFYISPPPLSLSPFPSLSLDQSRIYGC